MVVVLSTRPPAPGVVEQLRWMSGCWQGRSRDGSRVIDEQWMAPRARMMLGMSRTVSGDSAVLEFEHLAILERQGRAVYHAEPSEQKPADFTARVVSDTLAIFENLEHDFPQRVLYRRRGADSVTARIEGMRGGQLRGIDFPYGRVACP
jgi:hypothetical protein